MDDLSKELEVAKQAVVAAGSLIMQIYNSDNFDIQIKDDESPVTKADKISNDKICDFLNKHFDYPIISEESSITHEIPKNKVWILDPLDGTKNFIEKRREFSVMLALLYDYKPVLGLVYDVCNNFLYFSAINKGTYCEKKSKLYRCRINESSDPAMIISRHHFTEKDGKFAEKMGIGNFVSRSSIGLKAASIIENDASIYVNFDGLNLWDVAASYLLVKEAGGDVCDKSLNDLFECEKIPLRFTNGIFMLSRQLKLVASKYL